MKPYLLLPLFLLAALSIACFASGQARASEDSPSDTSSTETIEQSPFSDLSDPAYELPAGQPPKESDTFQAKFMNMLFILGLLIAFMLLASWMLKRMMKTRVTQLNTSSAIKVLETRYLSPRSTLYLLDVHGQSLLIAESPTGTVSLASFKTPLENEVSSKEGRSLSPYFNDPSKKPFQNP